MTQARLSRDYFEGLYAASDDPWSFATSDYERAKYDDTIGFLDGRRHRRALELGCSIGVLTARLAERCDELLAVDISERAVETARRRLAGLADVRVERAELPEELPAGPWDLIVASEVLYYWSADTLRDALGRLAGALAPDGRLLAVHWTEPTESYPLLGDEVHDLLRRDPRLRVVAEAVRPSYRVDVLAPAG